MRRIVPVLLAATLSACGSTEPEPLQAMAPAAPADLCAAVPQELRTGLQADATSDTSGDPTAACSLRSAPGTSPEVRGVITWLQLDDDGSADTVLDSQCRSIDRSVYTQQSSGPLKGADRACAASGRLGSADAATLATVTGRTVVTVRWSGGQGGAPAVMQRSRVVAESLLASLSQES